jgi:hypothetical protein
MARNSVPTEKSSKDGNIVLALVSECSAIPCSQVSLQISSYCLKHYARLAYRNLGIGFVLNTALLKLHKTYSHYSRHVEQWIAASGSQE